jgi:uncharacterized coiled-coil DUF342 family protein
MSNKPQMTRLSRFGLCLTAVLFSFSFLGLHFQVRQLKNEAYEYQERIFTTNITFGKTIISLSEKIDKQQNEIDELKRELEELKKNTP